MSRVKSKLNGRKEHGLIDPGSAPAQLGSHWLHMLHLQMRLK